MSAILFNDIDTFCIEQEILIAAENVGNLSQALALSISIWLLYLDLLWITETTLVRIVL